MADPNIHSGTVTAVTEKAVGPGKKTSGAKYYSITVEAPDGSDKWSYNVFKDLWHGYCVTGAEINVHWVENGQYRDIVDIEAGELFSAPASNPPQRAPQPAQAAPVTQPLTQQQSIANAVGLKAAVDVYGAFIHAGVKQEVSPADIIRIAESLTDWLMSYQTK